MTNRHKRISVVRNSVIAACLLGWLGSSQAAMGLEAQAVNSAQFEAASAESPEEPLIVKAQVLLSRAHFSPGEIDGKLGSNFEKALSAFATARGLPATGRLTEDLWRELTAVSSEPILMEYTIAEADVQGPFAKKIPARMEDMKSLPALSYVSARELLSEKFHQSQELLAELNPGKKFDAAGERITVVNATREKLGKVSRVVVNKTEQVLRAFTQDGKLAAIYPVTAGSTEKPSPNGPLKISIIKKNPVYRYNPEYKFKSVRSNKPFIIKPGPNNPVGAVWIGLSGDGYGLHGTAEPSKVGKTESHGCIRLTNWDALELADAVTKGLVVEFVGDERERDAARAEARAVRAKRQR